MRTPTRTHQAEKQGQTILPLFNTPITDPIVTPIETPPSVHVDTMDTYKHTPTPASSSVQSVQSVQMQETLEPARKLHQGHKYQYTFHYQGAQPIPKDAHVSPHGRTGSHKQAIFDWTAREKVQTFPGGTLMITIFHPEGQRTPAEADDAFNRASACMKQIARKFGLINWKMVKRSHSEHIVKDLGMDRALRPHVKADPKLFRERVGLVLDNTHKEYPAPKGEFNLEYKQAEARKDIKPKDIVTEMEFLHDNKTDIHFWIGEGKQSFAELAKANALLTGEVLKMSEGIRFVVEEMKRRR
ncbi:MAG: hypothetical protein Sv326_1340 (plasmid) [Candidatus Fermentimicrarchaeum limneticum]|uniref:Uncharacterized protein n=1 Tax=Fermentimicrarchaeum limneticum TaxID=2795018 RepID=A0A7D6BHQ7_FERL1|nr:MAG: hypothetical protein Sv326_1340 [Candidatus Fermentimicrarchaeum limneticum]